MRCLVVGAPRVGSRWTSAHTQLKEAELVADMLRVTPLTDYQASKEAVLAQLPLAECIHFATHICWKTPAIVLSPGEVVSSHFKLFGQLSRYYDKLNMGRSLRALREEALET